MKKICSKHRLWVHVRTATIYKNILYILPCKPQFYYIKVGCKGVYITQTCKKDLASSRRGPYLCLAQNTNTCHNFEGRTGAVVSVADYGPGVPGSRPGRRFAVPCGLEQVTFTSCLVLAKPRKPWTHADFDRL